MKNMEWIKLNEKLPEDEVLAANFRIGTYGYKEKLVGMVCIDDGVVTCDDGNVILKNCTHYIDLNQFDIDD